MTAPEPGFSEPIFQATNPAAETADNTDFTSDGAQITTIPTPILNVRYISSGFTEPASCKTLKTAGTFQLEVSITASSDCDSARSRFSGNPPPVTCAIACIRSRTGLSAGRYDRCSARRTSATVPPAPGNA